MTAQVGQPFADPSYFRDWPVGDGGTTRAGATTAIDGSNGLILTEAISDPSTLFVGPAHFH
ncbi:MAG: hypothetical protein JSS59_08260 [Proteobacteria bacterium]|uniref:hypothetical protein n=1 Tax=Rudaea sp. TaxID=2136325 RepID=UPI003783E12A|nr:hypothetical protein [Pseudomonadota bacterium]